MGFAWLVRDVLARHWPSVLCLVALCSTQHPHTLIEREYAGYEKLSVTIILLLKVTLDLLGLGIHSESLANVPTGPRRRWSLDDIYDLFGNLLSRGSMITVSALAFLIGSQLLGVTALFIEVITDINGCLTEQFLNNGVHDPTYVWDREIAVVTGGCGGIGSAIATKLVNNGTTVVVLDLGAWVGEKRIHYYKVDLTNKEALSETVKQIHDEIGRPTIVIANAGICRAGNLLDLSARDLALTFNTNTISLIYTAQEFLPDMIQRNHGHFLIVASQTAFLSTAGVSAYAASKSAAVALYEGLHSEVRNTTVSIANIRSNPSPCASSRRPTKAKRSRVRISCVNPSAVETPMFRGIVAPDNIIVPRLMPEDVATRVCKIIWSGTACNELMPAFACATPLTRILPGWMKVLAQDWAATMATQLTPRHVQS